MDDDFKKGKKYIVKQPPIDHVENMEVDQQMEKETEIKIKLEKEEQDTLETKEEVAEDKRPKKHSAADESVVEPITDHPPPPAKIWRGLRYKTWSVGLMQPSTKYKKPTDKEITEVRYGRDIFFS